MRLIAFVLVCSLAMAAEPSPRSAFNKATMEDYIRHLILVIDPHVQVTVEDPEPSPIAALRQEDVKISRGPHSDTLTFYVSEDGRYIIAGQTGVPGVGGIYDITESPFASILKKLNTNGAASFGSPDAPMSLVLFSDMECPECKGEEESLRKNLLVAFPTQVRVFFIDYPLGSIHPWATHAATIGRCVLQQGQSHFWHYVDWVYTNQADIRPENLRTRVERFADDEKLDEMNFGHCMENPAAMTAEVDKEIAIGRSLNIDETPTIFLNGRRLVGNVDWQNLKMIIQADLDYNQAHVASAQKECCEITLPSPLRR